MRRVETPQDVATGDVQTLPTTRLSARQAHAATPFEFRDDALHEEP